MWLLLFFITTVLSLPYNESLTFTPLPRNTIMASFNFNVSSNPRSISYHSPDSAAITDALDYTYFPRSFGPIIESNNIRELHLRFTQGWWNEQWGSLPLNGFRSGGTGVEIWSIIEAQTAQEALIHWKRSATQLSALFCASLNFIDESITTFPQNWSQLDLFTASNTTKLFLLRAAMPDEPICTENLAPLLKLLPTRGKAGVSSVLSGHKVFDSLWHSMAIDITTECSDKCVYHMEQSLSVIIDVMRSLRKKEEGDIPVPVPGDKLRCDTSRGYSIWQCFPLGPPTDYSFSLMDIFGRRIKGGPFDSEAVPVTVNFNSSGWDINIKEGLNKVILLTEKDATYYIKGNDEVDIDFIAKDSRAIVPPKEAPLLVSRSLTGYSQDQGGFRIVFQNNGDTTQQFVYSETLPWFLRLYLHTLDASIKTNGSYESVNLDDYVTISTYQPAIDRKRPSHLELIVTIPAYKTLTLDYKFDKSLLLYAEYPPDANHGFAVEPAIVTVLDNGEPWYQLRTTSSLVVLPTPDFSMPYNVIILTGTVISLGFGSLFNILIKDVITEQEYEKLNTGGVATRIKSRIQAIVGAVKKVIGL